MTQKPPPSCLATIAGQISRKMKKTPKSRVRVLLYSMINSSVNFSFPSQIKPTFMLNKNISNKKSPEVFPQGLKTDSVLIQSAHYYSCSQECQYS